ncbi:hypothetical protein JZ751_005897, partial [Albula glossodonta]
LPALVRVAVCGGTHGNELSGVYLVRERLKKKKKEEADTVSVMTVMSNPRAVQQCRRYTETDLNRCFTAATLSAPVSDRTPYEIVRSQELNTLLGPKGTDDAMDLICDLHNTTANMGLCLISYSDADWICLHIYKADIFNVMKEGVQLVLDWIHNFNSGVWFDGGEVEVYTMVKNIDYPRDAETRTITAAIHPQL